MRTITLLAVIAILLLEISGAVPQSSVGGPMTRAMVYLGATLVVGLYEAWSKKRGVLGWIVNIVVSVVGGYLGAEVGNIVLELTLTLLQLAHLGPEGSLAATQHPLLYVTLAVMMILMLQGSWIALRIVNRWR